MDLNKTRHDILGVLKKHAIINDTWVEDITVEFTHGNKTKQTVKFEHPGFTLVGGTIRNYEDDKLDVRLNCDDETLNCFKSIADHQRVIFTSTEEDNKTDNYDRSFVRDNLFDDKDVYVEVHYNHDDMDEQTADELTDVLRGSIQTDLKQRMR